MSKKESKIYCVIDHANKLVDRERSTPAASARARQGPFRRDLVKPTSAVLATDAEKKAEDDPAS